MSGSLGAKKRNIVVLRLDESHADVSQQSGFQIEGRREGGANWRGGTVTCSLVPVSFAVSLRTKSAKLVMEHSGGHTAGS